jgi:radical SAM enzyme (TIGR01210 family)
LSKLAKSRDTWILSQRGKKNAVDPYHPYNYLVEEERSADGAIETVATIFLTNKECPFTCLMCDLWQNTTDEAVPPGAIPGQIKYALSKLPPATHVKLYNNGNFFDVTAIPESDYAEIAALVSNFKTVTVESHPKLLGDRTLTFQGLLKPDLNVAVGLESIHPGIIESLNKQMSLAEFNDGIGFLTTHNISSRAFILLNLPFLTGKESVKWAMKSIDFAFSAGVECTVVIPTRSGNGAMDFLQRHGAFYQPTIQALEEVLDYGVRQNKGRVFADLWDIQKFSTCEHCLAARMNRIKQMNLSQSSLSPIRCNYCEAN